MEVLTEREIVDKFLDENLMVLISNFNDDEPWYANFVNYIVGKVVPPNWTFKKRKRFFSQVKTYFWEEPYAFKLCADNIMRRCVAEIKHDKMAEENVLAPAPTRSNKQILPFNAWLPIGSRHNIHRRPASSVHFTGDDFLLVKEGGKKKTASKVDKPKKPTPAKQSKPAPAKPSKPMKKKTSKPSPAMKIPKGKVMKVRKGKSSYQLVDEEEEVQLAPKPQVEDDEYNLQRGIQMSLESFQAPISRVAIREPTSGITQKLPVVKVIKDASTGPSAQPQDDTSANVVRDTLSPADAETGADTENTNSEADTKILNVGEEQGEDVSNTVVLEERIVELDEAEAGI
ncbi:hypothetical protein Tco_0906342 [Tanacetum coccineum]|uniref:Uncharacterized protein n=1 Tax=Tanacetum coccineum TaxID=301880 RepID=A0ABQ5CI95_9ASTR